MNIRSYAAIVAACSLLASCASTGEDPRDVQAAHEVRQMESALAASNVRDPATWDRLGGTASEVDDAVAKRAFERAENLMWPDSTPKNETRLSLPFDGTWVVTQGNRGDYSHSRLADRFAWDFQKVDARGEASRDGSGTPKSFYSFGSPVRATGDGVVVRAEDGVPDNIDGIRNYGRAGGNLVVIRHPSGEMSHFCHMQRGSIAVHVGDVVSRGQMVGRCGCSGNAVEPHLHYVLRMGPTSSDYSVPAQFEATKMWRHGKGPFVGDVVPRDDDVVEATRQ